MAEVRIKKISLREAKRAMSQRDLVDFEESLSFGHKTDWPAYLTIRGERWALHRNYGGSVFPKRVARKAAQRIAHVYPNAKFLIVDAAWKAGVPLYFKKS